MEKLLGTTELDDSLKLTEEEFRHYLNVTG